MGKAERIGGWSIGKHIGGGGNADVYEATRDGTTAAFKIVRHPNPKRAAGKGKG